MELAIRVIGDDLTRLDELEVPYMAVHPGSHVGQGTSGYPKSSQSFKYYSQT